MQLIDRARRRGIGKWGGEAVVGGEVGRIHPMRPVPSFRLDAGDLAPRCSFASRLHLKYVHRLLEPCEGILPLPI